MEIEGYSPIFLYGDKYNIFLQKCNDSSKEAIRSCYIDFVYIGKPIITKERIDGLVASYKVNMPNHYESFFGCLNLIKRVV